MRILVTGGAGFIGSNFIHYWLKNHPQDKIINLDKLTYAGNLENLKDAEDNPRYTFVKGDICDSQFVNKIVQDVDKIVHFAAESHVDRSIMDPTIFVKTNVLGTQVLLEAALKYKIKHFHHISTDEVFGSLDINSKEKFNEETPFRPNSPYSASKAGSDCLVRAYFKTYDLPVTITNTSNNYGPYQFPEKLISLMITNALEKKKLPVYGEGLNIRDWLYVGDHCRAIDLVLRKGKIGETYCIGGDIEKNNLEVVNSILNIMGDSKEKIEFVKDRPGHDLRYAINSSKAKRELGYQPECVFEEYLEKTIYWYKKNEDWWKSVKSGKYKEYYKKQYGK